MPNRLVTTAGDTLPSMGKLWRLDPQSRLDLKETRVEVPSISLSNSPTGSR